MRYVILFAEGVVSDECNHDILGCVRVGSVVRLWNNSFQVLDVTSDFLVNYHTCAW